MNEHLLNPEIQQFISENYKIPTSEIVLKGSPFKAVSVQELATQIFGKRKAERKLPTWFKNNQILYPPTLNLEQTSSEITAEYKASLISGKSLADLTGGFGIDTFFFSKKTERVVYFEINTELSELARHNFKVLASKNIQTINKDAIAHLKAIDVHFDWIFIDPSRRDDAGGRVFLLSDCIPNVPENLDFLFQKTDQILLKTSPLLDISAGISELKNISEIHIVAVNNDVKELLWVLEKVPSEAIKLKTINFKNNENQVFESSFEENENAQISFSSPLTYLFEPNPAIMKSGMFSSLGSFFNLKKLQVNTHLFTSGSPIENFPGRSFKIEKILDFNGKKLKKELNISTANITTRNFPLSVAEIRKRFKIAEGGETYMFFTTIEKEKKIVLICRKL